MAATVFCWSIRFRVISCGLNSLNFEVLNLRCTKELQKFASTKVLMVRKLDRLNAIIHRIFLRAQRFLYRNCGFLVH